MNKNNINLEEDAIIKIDKLIEIVQDIEINGHEGDQFARQVVLSSILNSTNEILWNKLEEILIKEDQTELMKTIIVGLLMQKGNIIPICDYAKGYLKDIITINEDFEDKESFILIADALIKGTSSEDDNIKAKSCELLFKLFNASCHPDSSALIADQLLQRFINTMANKSNVIDNNLLKLIENIESEINSRIISIDILSRSQPVEFFEKAKELLFNLKENSKNNIEQLYLLDILTKYIYNAVNSNLGIELSSLNKILCTIKAEDILKEAKAEYGSDNEHLDTINKRVLRRIAQINEIINSNN